MYSSGVVSDDPLPPAMRRRQPSRAFTRPCARVRSGRALALDLADRRRSARGRARAHGLWRGATPFAFRRGLTHPRLSSTPHRRGAFLSARHDVLRQVLGALGDLDVRVAVATGPSSSATPGPLPDGWLSRPTVPQIAVLQHAAAVVTHGGNNTVTESLAAAAPVVTMPFSTDQFAIAADLERTTHGAALDPNRFGSTTFTQALECALSADAQQQVRALATSMARRPGPVVALDRRCGTSTGPDTPDSPIAPDGDPVRPVRR
jgi:UDP-glucoronosyl and UDP-glucosyl transferase